MPELREDRPAYVKFERRPIEDRTTSIKEGRYIAKDVDFAVVTPIGSKDEIPQKVDTWIETLRQQAREGRIPAGWPDQYWAAYQAWKRGEDLPLQGTPIKGWAVLSPAQQQNIIGANVLTVEDLAGANGEAIQRIGMGAVELKKKAEAWLRASNSAGKMVQENSALQAQVRTLQAQLEEQSKVVLELREKLEKVEA